MYIYIYYMCIYDILKLQQIGKNVKSDNTKVMEN